MAINPMLYEKMSGRKGDPYSRMGEALAGAETAKAARKATKEMSYTEARMRARMKMNLYMIVLGAIAVVIFVVARAIFG